jgi:hypothetical protein
VQALVEAFAFLQVEVILIVDPARDAGAVENAGGGDDRPGQRRASRFVHAGEWLRERKFELEAGPAHAPQLIEAHSNPLELQQNFCG